MALALAGLRVEGRLERNASVHTLPQGAVRPEDSAFREVLGVKEPTPDELVYAAAGAERGIQGQPRVGPLPSHISQLDIVDPRVPDVNEAFREGTVAGDQLFTNSERIHACSPVDKTFDNYSEV